MSSGGPSTSVRPQIARVHVKPDTPMCWLHLGNRKTYSLVDSGADISLISKETFDKIAAKDVCDFSTKNCVPLQSVSGHKLKNFGTVVLQVKLAKFSQPHRFQIVNGLRNQCILGNDFLSNFGAQLDFGQKTLNIDGNVIPLRPQRLTCDSVTSLVRVPQQVTIPAQSYVEIPGQINRAQLIEQDCIVQPLSNAPVLGEEPGLCVVESVGKVAQNRKIPVVIVNTTGRDYTLPARSVIGLAEVISDPEARIATVEEFIKSEEEKSEGQMSGDAAAVAADTVQENKKANLSHVSESQRQKIQDVLDRNADLFAKNDCDLGQTHLVKAKIDTGDHPPIQQKPYRLPFSQRQLVEQHIQDMLKAGVIEPSQSPWASPIVIVDKKDGSKRFCVDYRAVNKVLKKNSYPLPRIDDILASLDGSQYFTCLDLKSGYWQVPVEEASRDVTTFTCFAGNFRFLKLPFGIMTAPALFSELMNKTLSGVQHKFAMAYLDDIIIYSKTFEDHLEHIEAVFSRLREAGLKLKMSKCDFLKREVNYLGHVVSASGIKPDPQKVEAIQKLAAPTDVKGVRQFIGLSSYYRRFINQFAKIAKPLTELTKKNRRFHWTEECQTAFETLRNALIEAPVLAYPDLKKPYKVYTDASNNAIGAALVQDTEMGERVIQYLSHQLNGSQLHWPIIEKEAYAIVYSIQKFRPYLLGSKFTVMTDHKPLKHLFTSEMRNARVQRWAIMLDEYGCDVEYISASKNIVADALSRLGPVGGRAEETMASAPSGGGPANYAGRVEEGDRGQSFIHEDDAGGKPCRVNVIDSDRAPGVQLETKVKSCGDQGHRSKEKFREFLESHPDFSVVQSEDPEIQRIVKVLNDPSHSSYADISRYYVMEDGIVYRITDPEKCESFSGLQLVIPEFLQKPLIEEIHSGYFGGHLGVDKTYDKVRSRYYWSGMYRDVVQYLKTCVACNMRKLKRQRPPLQDMQIPKYPFEQIAIDTSGPFPESFNGNRYIINVIDLFSGWPESFATKSKSAETVAQILIEKIIPRHSCPRVIVSDNGTEFCNAIIEQISAFFNIKRIRTSIFHPQGNGKCERFNRVQNDMLAKMVSPSQRDWDTKLPAILSAYRSAKNETTKYSPFYILYGRDPILPMDTLLSPKYRYQGEDYVPTMLENLHSAYHQVRHNLARSHEKNKMYYDRKAKPVNLKVGDMVYFRDPSEATQSSKLSSNWKPFYRVVKVLSDVTYVIKNQLSGGTKVVNAHNLRLADPTTLWKNVTEEPTGINHKYEQHKRSFIPLPLRVQPPRRSKFSAADVGDGPSYESEPEPVRETVPPVIPNQHEPEKLPPIPENLPELPETESEPEQMTDEDDLPLAELQRRWREEKAQEEIEENLPLSELAKNLASKPSEPVETPSVPVKRPRDRSESSSSDLETRSPSGKYSCVEPSDVDSDSTDIDTDLSTGECMARVEVTNPSVSKAQLLSQLMKAQQTMMEKNQAMMDQMLAVVSKL